MDAPLISVIVPVYKKEAYLDACVQSIVDQTYENLEILLVDDGSPDRCPQMCDQWALRDPRIRVIHKRNGGASSARNAGLDAARGQYIGFVDSDDTIDPQMYALLLETIQTHQAGIAAGQITYVAAELGTVGVAPIQVLTPQETLERQFWGKISDSTCDKLYRREVWEDLRFPEGVINEEYPIFVPMMFRAEKICRVDRPVYYYRTAEGSVTATVWQSDADQVLLHLRQMAQQLEAFGMDPEMESFRYFTGTKAFWVALQLDKYDPRLSAAAKENLREYRKLVRRHLPVVMKSGQLSWKHKLLCAMVATGTLRPIYGLLGKLE